MTLVKDVDDQVFILRLPDRSTDFNSSTSLFRGQTTIRGLLQRHEDMHKLVEDKMSSAKLQLSESVNRSSEAVRFVRKIKESATSNCRNFAGTIPKDKRKIPQKNEDDYGRMIIEKGEDRSSEETVNAGGQEVGSKVVLAQDHTADAT